MSVAVIYTRVSTTEQAEKQSLVNQENICRDFAARRDFEVDRVFVEAGESAKTADRTQLLLMIKYCQEQKGRIKYVIVYKVDRFARRTEDHLTLKSLLMKLGIQLLSATEPIENTNTGNLMETILAGFAQFDNGVRSERSRGGMKTRIEQGCWVHQAPIGYRNVKDAQKRPTLEADEMAPNVQRFLREFKKGIYSEKQGIDLAREYGIKTKKNKVISANGVRKMIRNPIYAGLVTSKMIDGVVQGLHQGLISVEEYEAIAGILAGRRRSFLPETRGKPKWPLRRFALCGRCKHPLTGSTSRGRSKQFDYYHCTKCKGRVRVLRDNAHTEFEALLERVKPARGSLKLFKEIAIRRWNEEFREVQEQRRKLDDRIRGCEDDKNAIVEKSLKGTFDDDTTKEQLDRVAIRKAELQLTRSELYEGEVEKEVIVDYAINFMAQAGHLWRDAPLEDRQRFQKMVYPDGIPYIFDQGFGTAKMSDCYEETRLIEAEKQKETVGVSASSGSDNAMVVPRGIEPRLLE